MGTIREMTLRFALLAAVGACLYAAVGCGDDDPPNGPQQPSEYPFWTVDTSTDMIYRVWPKSSRVDSMVAPWDIIKPISVSAGGRRLYLPLSDGIIVADTAMTYIDELPYTGTVYSSPDGALIAVTGIGLRILRTSDYTELFSIDTGYSHDASFVNHNAEMVCIYSYAYGALRRMMRIDLAGDSIIDSVYTIQSRSLYSLQPTNDPDRWLIYTKPPVIDYYSFGVYDIGADSFVYEQLLSPGEGETIFLKSRNLAVYNNPGGVIIFGLPPSSKLTFLDAVSLQLTDSVDTWGFINDSTPKYLYPTCLASCPEDRYVTTVGGAYSGQLVTYDMEADSFVIHVDNYRLVGLSCQSRH